jgi:imidazolonepropionase-like amidohydrolase
LGTLLVDCDVVDCTGAPPIRDAALLIDGNRIAGVGPRAELAPNAERDGHTILRLGGATLLPGLWDAHIHLGAVVPPWDERFRNESETDYAYRCVRKAQDCLAAGITSIRGMSDRFNADLKLKAAVEAGYVQGPRVFAAGEATWSTHYRDPQGVIRQATGVDAFRRHTRDLLWAGVDHIKLFASAGIPFRGQSVDQPTCTLEELRASVEAAHQWGKPVGVHATGDEAVINATQAGADTIEHGFMITERGIDAMLEHGCVFSPQLTVTRAWNGDFIRRSGQFPEWFARNAEAAGRTHHQMVARAAEAGLRMIAGVDNLPRVPLSVGIETYEGRPALVMEIRLMAEIGLSPLEALRTATANVADVCGVADQLGTLEPGKLADLIAVPGDPLQDLCALYDARLVVKDGAIVSSAYA